MKSRLAIQREYSRVNRARREKKSLEVLAARQAVQQALAWVLDDNAARPSVCYGYAKKARRKP